MSTGLEGVDGKAQSMFSVCVHVTGFNQSLSQRLSESESERLSDSSERQRQRQSETERIRGTVLDIDGSLENRIGKESEREREREREKERGRDKGKRINSNSSSNSNSKTNSNNNSKSNSRTNSKTNSRSDSASNLHTNGSTHHHTMHYLVKQGRPNVEGSIARIAAHGYRALVFVCGPAPMVAQAAALSMQYGVDFRHETFEL